MSDQVLNILKLSLLGLVYLFFARVLWAVWSEVKTPRGTTGRPHPAAATRRPADRQPRRRHDPPRPLPHASPPRDAAGAPGGS